MISTVLLSFVLASSSPPPPPPPAAVVGADRPVKTVTTTTGTIETTCLAFKSFAVVVTDERDTKGTDGIEMRTRTPKLSDAALCAADFAGKKHPVQMTEAVYGGNFLAVKGSLLLLSGDDVFGAHDQLTIYRVDDGALLLTTTRFDDEPVVLRQRGATIHLGFLQALTVGCDLRPAETRTACLAKLRADNGLAADAPLEIDVATACRAVPSTTPNLQLGVAAEIVDGAKPVVRIVGGRVHCTGEP